MNRQQPPSASAATDQPRGPAAPNEAPTQCIGPVARAWLKTMFFLAGRAPWVLRLLRPVAVGIAERSSAEVRRATGTNASRLFGKQLAPGEQRRFTRGVLGSFYDFIVDVGRNRDASLLQLRSQIEAIEGRETYVAARAARRGAVLVTAHMGSFEVGLAALTDVEKQIHVVFKRDEAFPGFEEIRSALRARLGVSEAPIDDGWGTLLKLRNALERDEVVVIQGDRAYPGQRAENCKVAGGHLRLPAGPVTLARLVGSPIVPVFVVRQPGGRFRVSLLEPISADDPSKALRRIAAAIEAFVTRYPEQWLVLHEAFVEDQPSG